MTVVIASLTDEPIDVARHLDAVATPVAGATATFLGTVRDHDPDVAGAVHRLDYSAHPDAAAVLRRIAEAHDGPGRTIAVTHRVGRLGIGDLAIVAACATAHRAEAFDVCRDLVEAVKAELPVWKKQFAVDGSSNWVGL